MSAGPPAWGLGKALTTPQCKNWPVTKWTHVPEDWSNLLVRPK
jgi:rubredoxin